MVIKNNVTRLLDSRKVDYQAFELPAEKLGALKTAQLLNVSPDLVFKTIVVARDKPGKPILAVIPGNREVDLKALAAILDEKKIHLATQREAEQITGLQTGGISPLALVNKGFLVIIDQSAVNAGTIHISGGQRGLNLRLPVRNLVELTRARFAAICTQSTSADEMES